MVKKIVKLEDVSLPFDELTLGDDELIVITGGSGMGDNNGCNCDCNCNCNCNCGTNIGCNCNCDCNCTPTRGD